MAALDAGAVLAVAAAEGLHGADALRMVADAEAECHAAAEEHQSHDDRSDDHQREDRKGDRAPTLGRGRRDGLLGRDRRRLSYYGLRGLGGHGILLIVEADCLDEHHGRARKGATMDLLRES
ncbi:MAG TPA: hypothetical protein VGM70_03900 [Pseudolysinimonas sp.]